MNESNLKLKRKFKQHTHSVQIKSNDLEFITRYDMECRMCVCVVSVACIVCFDFILPKYRMHFTNRNTKKHLK